MLAYVSYVMHCMLFYDWETSVQDFCFTANLSIRINNKVNNVNDQCPLNSWPGAVYFNIQTPPEFKPK